MRHSMRILLAVGLAVLGQLGAARAQTDANANVNITADAMEVFDAEHRTVFKGNVNASQSGDQIQADQMTVTNVDVKQDDGTTKSVADIMDARGNVTITTKNALITGDQSLYHIRANTMTVTGNVTLTQGKNIVRGQKLDIDLKGNHMQMTGGRVSGSFVPK